MKLEKYNFVFINSNYEKGRKNDEYFSFWVSTMVTEWDLVCEKLWLKTAAKTILFTGQQFGPGPFIHSAPYFDIFFYL